ncbi:hypothetical protein PR048_019977 [Dryococelus australis]|uniref:Transposase n=1 Tax=Dryococelus australis TaxID=614101 RepID=A0ABQ9H527_9NEOP|nr:hypothetical protein PR048_019977 [Dryococelus australis]
MIIPGLKQHGCLWPAFVMSTCFLDKQVPQTFHSSRMFGNILDDNFSQRQLRRIRTTSCAKCVKIFLRSTCDDVIAPCPTVLPPVCVIQHRPVRIKHCRHGTTLQTTTLPAIVGLREAGWSFRRISQRAGREGFAVHHYRCRWYNDGAHDRQLGSGRQRLTDSRLDRRVRRAAIYDRTATAAQIRATRAARVSARTINNRLLKAGQASSHTSSPCSPHRTVGASECRLRARRRPGERHQPECLRQQHTGPTTGIMVWGVIAYNDHTPRVFVVGIQNSERYIQNNIQTFLLFLQRQGDLLFTQNSAHAHKFRVTQRALEGTCQLPRPARLPDLPPTEFVWGIIRGRFGAVWNTRTIPPLIATTEMATNEESASTAGSAYCLYCCSKRSLPPLLKYHDARIKPSCNIGLKPILHDTCSRTWFLYKLLQALVHKPRHNCWLVNLQENGVRPAKGEVLPDAVLKTLASVLSIARLPICAECFCNRRQYILKAILHDSSFVKACARSAIEASIRASVAPVVAFPALCGQISYQVWQLDTSYFSWQVLYQVSYLANHIAVSEQYLEQFQPSSSHQIKDSAVAHPRWQLSVSHTYPSSRCSASTCCVFKMERSVWPELTDMRLVYGSVARYGRKAQGIYMD